MRWMCVFCCGGFMRRDRRQIALALFAMSTLLVPAGARAQDPQPPPDAGAGQHDHMHMAMPMNDGWQFMQDGIVFAEFNHQGGPRGGNEFVLPNWWMGMATRELPRGRLTLTSILSLDAATVGRGGYREIRHAAEPRDGHPLLDPQH